MARYEIIDAPCQSANDPDIFFPDPTEHLKIIEAKSLCASCKPADKNACLTFALTNNVAYGIFGGLTEGERQNLKRREQRHKYQSVAKEF